MAIGVKICGIRTEEALGAALEAGADYVGFVFFPRSPRHVELDRAAKLADLARGRVKIVALTVNASGRQLTDITHAVRPDFLQLHGDETIERIKAIKVLTGSKVIKAVKVRGPDDISASLPLEAEADILLFDAHVTAGNPLPGGNGIAFNWHWLRDYATGRNFMLSGGLNPDNVQTAIHASGAPGVDVSTGVELAPGVKSPELIRRFVAQAKSIAPAQAL